MKKSIKIFYGMYAFICIFFICTMYKMIWLGLCAKGVVTVLFILFLFSEEDFATEKKILSIVAMLYNVGLFLDARISEQYKLFNILCIVVILSGVVCYFLRSTRKNNLQNIKNWFGQYWSVLMLILIFALLSIEVIDAWAMWDSHVYYAFPYGDNDIVEMVNSLDANFSGFDNLFLANHVSIGYALWVFLFQMFGKGIKMVRVANIVLAGISIYAYYQIIRKLLREHHSDKLLILSVIPYAFSPFVLGMVWGIDVDIPGMYFAVIWIAYFLYHYRCLELVAASCFCLTKEPNIIYYVCYIIAKIICDYKLTEKFNLRGLIKYGFGRVEHYIYALPILLWGVLYHYKGWGKTETGTMHVFGINSIYIISKLKQVFLLNFNWIFWLTILIGIVCLFIKRVWIDNKLLAKSIPIFFLGLSVVVFGCIFITCTHTRYIAVLIPMLYLSTTCIVGMLKSKVFVVWNIMISLLLFIQSFYVIDPIMAHVFPSISIGSTKIYSMYEYGVMQFHDSIIYNRQAMYWQKALRIVLKKAGYSQDMLCVLPDAPNCSRYNLFGDHISVWNSATGELEYYDENKNVSDKPPIDVVNVAEIGEGNYDKYKKYLYIIPEWATFDDEFVKRYDIQREGEVKYKGYYVKYMVINAK